MADGIELIKRERERQITEEGWTVAHDDEHVHGELAQAAATASFTPAESEHFPVSPAPNDYGVKEGQSMTKNYDDYRAGMLRAAEMCRNEFKRAPEAAKGHDCVYMGGYEDACDHLSSVIAQAAVIDSVRIAGAQPDWQYHISLLLPDGIEDETLLKIYQVVEHELRAATPPESTRGERSWIDNLVGTFDDSPLHAEVIANEKRARQRMEEGRCVSCGALPLDSDSARRAATDAAREVRQLFKDRFVIPTENEIIKIIERHCSAAAPADNDAESLLTDREAKLVIGAMPMQSLPDDVQLVIERIRNAVIALSDVEHGDPLLSRKAVLEAIDAAAATKGER